MPVCRFATIGSVLSVAHSLALPAKPQVGGVVVGATPYECICVGAVIHSRFRSADRFLKVFSRFPQAGSGSPPHPGQRKGLFGFRKAATCLFDWCSMRSVESLSTGVESLVDKEENRCSWDASQNASSGARGFGIRPRPGVIAKAQLVGIVDGCVDDRDEGV